MTNKAVIIGAGRIAGLNEADPARRKPCTHLGALRFTPTLEVAGVVDANLDAAKHFARTFDIPFCGTSIAEAMKIVEPEIVTVAVPYGLQCDVVKEVLASGCVPKKMLLEKPIANSLSAAKSIIDRCAENGVSILVNNEAASPVYRQIAELLSDHFDNGVISASAWCSSGMHAVGIHMLGVLRVLFGRVVWVRGIAEQEYIASLPYSNNYTPDDPRIHGMLVFESGISAFLTNSALTDYTYKELEVTCRTGKLRLSNNCSQLEVWDKAVPGSSSISWRLQSPRAIPVNDGTAFTEIARFLADDDLEAGQALIGGGVALDTYNILDSLIRSSQSNTDVPLVKL
jgi:predicted dehydrogenase